MNNFGEHVAQQKEKKRREDAKKQDIEEELANARKRHTELVNEHGELSAEAKVSRHGNAYGFPPFTDLDLVIRLKQTGSKIVRS